MYGCAGWRMSADAVPLLDDPAGVRDRDPIGDRARHGQVVRDEQQRDAGVVDEVHEQVEDLGLDGGVERRSSARPRA